METNDKISILCVDDEPINLMVFELSLKEKYNILKASTAFEGIQVLDSNPNVKIIVSDMKMPGLDGVEFVRIVKKDYPRIGIFIVTGFEMKDEIVDGLNEKVIYKYFRKPLDMNEFEEAIEGFLVK